MRVPAEQRKTSAGPIDHAYRSVRLDSLLHHNTQPPTLFKESTCLRGRKSTSSCETLDLFKIQLKSFEYGHPLHER
jgi:hypothetical protein